MVYRLLPGSVPLLPVTLRNLPEQEKLTISSISGLSFWSRLARSLHPVHFNSNQKLRRY